VVHEFGYAEHEVRRLMNVAARLAALRERRLSVVVKRSGLPELSALWLGVAEDAARAHNVQLSVLDVDYAAYQLIARPGDFDVVAVANCFGDILADLGGLVMGSRGVTYGASYALGGAAVYQTNHGAAHDLTGRDVANPGGQILALAMLLMESFGLAEAAALLVASLRTAWCEGWRTADIATPGCKVVGTRKMGEVLQRTIVRQFAQQGRHGCTSAAG
jgi:3-isopropylmalate dehydrogenase